MFRYLLLFTSLTLVKANINHVVLIGIDGLNPSCIYNATSHKGFDRLSSLGMSTLKARTTIQTCSAPGWSSTLCSMRPTFTGITTNQWQSPNDTGTKVRHNSDGGFEAGSFPIPPTVFPFPCIISEMKRQDPERKTFVYYNWPWLAHVTKGADETFVLPDANATSDARLVKEFMEDFSTLQRQNTSSFSFLYIGNVDDTGHHTTWCSDAYEAYVGVVDGYLSTILNMIDLETTLLVLTADHGGVIGTTHHSWGGKEALEIPLFLAGPSISQGSSPPFTLRNLDIPPTIFHRLGLKPHHEWTGRVIV